MVSARIALAIALCGAVALPALPATAAPGVADDPPRAPGALGANFNQDLASADFGELAVADADWVRGFVTMPQVDDGPAADNSSISTILDARERGHSTIMSLKFPYYDKAFPTPGSADMATELERLDKVLPLIMGAVDIIVVGNEPFIESRKTDRDESLNVFYETMARHVINFRADHCGSDCDTDLYMGALNRLDLPDRLTPAAERWMTFVRETPEISGTDIHPHVPTLEASREFLDYILPRMRPDQTFLSTEFSIVWYWKQHLSDPVDPGFLSRYDLAEDLLVWEVIALAIEHPFPERQWRDFLNSSPWFADRRTFLCDQMKIFRDTDRLAVATYGFRQDEPMTTNFGPDKTPWLLNSVFAVRTVQPGTDGFSHGYWVDDFKKLQRNGHACGKGRR